MHPYQVVAGNLLTMTISANRLIQQYVRQCTGLLSLQDWSQTLQLCVKPGGNSGFRARAMVCLAAISRSPITSRLFPLLGKRPMEAMLST